MTDHACDVCIVGAGSAGLSVAAGCAQLGLATVLVEHGTMGGECLNTGCVPSKALLAVAKRAHAGTAPAMAGLGPVPPVVDFGAVKDGVQAVIDTIAPHDSAERFVGLGATVLRDTARFTDARTMRVGPDRVRARWFVLATGSRPAVPAIPGLDPQAVFTNETIFALREPPAHLVILGGGPIGVEMAVAHRRLGVAVTLIDRGTILPRDEPELVAVLRTILLQEGIAILETTAIRGVEHGPGRFAVMVETGGRPSVVTGSHGLLALGRTPVTQTLDLAAAGVAVTPAGITVDARLRTSQPHIFALGDVIDGPHFTHAAGYQAGIVVRNLAFRLPARVDYAALPWVTYCDPELAHVGLTEAQARRRHGTRVAVQTIPLSRNDRAIAERRPEGLLKVVLGARGRILGASLLAPAAGEAIGLWCLAVSRRLTMKAMADLILPYPTLGETAKAAASDYFAPRLFGAATRRVVGALKRLPGWVAAAPRTVLLVGAGHAHVEVLRSFAKTPPGARVVLATRERFTPYSGMVPELVAGLYAFEEAHVDAQRLAAAAGARFVGQAIVGLDRGARQARCADGHLISYDVLSLDVGATPSTHGVPGADQHALSVKPIDRFLARFAGLLDGVQAGTVRRIAVVGGGPGGVELAFAVDRRLRQVLAAAGHDPAALAVQVVCGSGTILPTLSAGVAARVNRLFAARGITVLAGARVTAVEAGRLLFADHPPVPADAILWVTQAAAPAWLAATGLPLDPAGFVRVGADLAVPDTPGVFAAGDVAGFAPRPLPKAGVYAVRQGPVLAANIRRALAGRPLGPYRPQRDALVLLSTGERRAIGTRNGLVVEGRWVWHLKDWLDRRWVRRDRA